MRPLRLTGARKIGPSVMQATSGRKGPESEREGCSWLQEDAMADIASNHQITFPRSRLKGVRHRQARPRKVPQNTAYNASNFTEPYLQLVEHPSRSRTLRPSRVQ